MWQSNVILRNCEKCQALYEIINNLWIPSKIYCVILAVITMQ